MQKKIIIVMLVIITLGVIGSSLVASKAKAVERDISTYQSINGIDSASGGPRFQTVDIITTVSGGAPKGPFDDIGAALRWVIEQVKKNLEKAYEQSGAILYKNSLKYFLNRVAYDTATYIATGDKGQKPLFISEGWKKYFQSVGDEAVGDFFYRLGQEMWGKNLCEPWNPLVKIDLTVAAKKALEPQRPVCTWVKIKKNINDLRDLNFNELVHLSTHFAPGTNELGTYLTMRTGAYEYKVKQEKESNLVRIIEGSFKSVTNPVTGAIKTPASVVDNAINTAFSKTFSASEVYTGSPMADAIGTFTNTLVSKYLERIFKKGFNTDGSPVISDFWSLGGLQAARLFFSDLAEPDYNFNVGMRLDELTVDGVEQFNAVITDKFALAVERKCTLGQAMGLYKSNNEAYRAECLEGGKPLIDPLMALGYTSQAGVEPDANSGLAYRSLLVLRKFRIVPVGWELAAEYYDQFGRADKTPFTLSFVVSKFNDKGSPYYGLVDPDWLLKFPITRCAKEGAGPQIITKVFAYCLSNSGLNEASCDEKYRVYALQRLDYCADYETCLDDTGGSCAESNYGYCLEEKPVWNIQGTMCLEKYYASCQTLTKVDNTKVSYLLNTVAGASICNEASAGCRQYCTQIMAPYGSDNWICDAADVKNITYLTAVSQTCDKSKEGCSLIYRSTAKDALEIDQALSDGGYGLLEKKYVKLAPGYYSCAGYTEPVSGITKAEDCLAPHFWRSDLNICVVSGTKECANYTRMCQASDASCKLYTPIVGGSVGVPAVTSADDICPADCVGYKNYHQEKTEFEAAIDVNLIASSAKTCSTPGCDQFTNLDEVAKGGEGLEYYSFLRLCRKPDAGAGNQRTYYTWEGSDTSGYQLKKWVLVASGSAPIGTICSNLTEKDCREFYDESLQVYRIYYSSTIIVSDDCHPYRRTITNVTDCLATHGSWENGQCIYMSIPSENIACSADNNMCREYKSNSGYNYQKIITSSFSSLTDTGSWTGGEIRPESLRRNDYSMYSTGELEHSLAAGDLEKDKMYVMEFLAKGTGAVSARLTDGGVEVVSEGANLGSDWQVYSLRLPANNLLLTEEEAANQKVIISGSGYFDNIVFKRMEKTYLIKDSWQTPEICDLPIEGAEVGCEAYRDSDGGTVYLKSFNKFCFEDVVGCEKVIKTNNYLTDKTQHDPDYLVVNKNYMCDDKSVGCTRLGLMTPDRTDTENFIFTDQYKLVNPEDTSQVCRSNQVFCDKFTDSSNQIYYFKYPANLTCEYKEGVWVKSGANEACETDDRELTSEKHCVGGSSLRTDGTCSVNSDCTNLNYPGRAGLCTTWTGLCVDNSSGCREYQDPAHPDNCNKNLVNYANKYVLGVCSNDSSRMCDVNSDCTSVGVCVKMSANDVCNYYYYKNVEECDGGVNPNQGCAAFNDTNREVKDKRSYKVCDNDLTRACEVDADCGGGSCRYTNIQ